jgi:hypothetical protein
VRVTDPHRPLFGQQFATLPERSSRGAGFVVITLADGRRRSIRRAATDLGGTAAIAAESRSALPRVSARTILPLAHHLARTFASFSKEEVIRDDDPCLSPSRSVPALIKPPTTPPRIWSGLGAQTQVQVAQALAVLMRRMTFGTSVTEVFADSADERVGSFVVDEIGWFGDPAISTDFVGVGVEFVEEADEAQSECVSLQCRLLDGLGERARPRYERPRLLCRH